VVMGAVGHGTMELCAGEADSNLAVSQSVIHSLLHKLKITFFYCIKRDMSFTLHFTTGPYSLHSDHTLINIMRIDTFILTKIFVNINKHTAQ
jgi:hypothetical protein